MWQQVIWDNTAYAEATTSGHSTSWMVLSRDAWNSWQIVKSLGEELKFAYEYFLAIH